MQEDTGNPDTHKNRRRLRRKAHRGGQKKRRAGQEGIEKFFRSDGMALIFLSLVLVCLFALLGPVPKEDSAPQSPSGREAQGGREGLAPRAVLSYAGGKDSLGGVLAAFFSNAREAAAAGRQEAAQSLRAEYEAILDRGEGALFAPDSDAARSLWEEVRAARKASLQADPFLLLVNKWHYLPEDYEADPVDLPNGQRIDRRCHDELMRMLQDCQAAGGTPVVCSGYRPHWYQENLFAAQIDRWLYAGYGQEDAEALAATAVAIPGTSEHELGLAADIYSSENMDLDESQIYTFTQQWLMENCWQYGFVLRYPKDKSEITGIIFEPWHYRYVGHGHAKKIHDAGICLEEYLDEAAHP